MIEINLCNYLSILLYYILITACYIFFIIILSSKIVNVTYSLLPLIYNILRLSSYCYSFLYCFVNCFYISKQNDFSVLTKIRVLQDFFSLAASDEAGVVAAMRTAFEDRPSTVGVRVFAYPNGGKVDYIGFVSAAVPDDAPVEPRLFAGFFGAIDLFNTYVPRPR